MTSSSRSLLEFPAVEGLSPPKAVLVAQEYLARHEVDSPRRTAEILLMHVLGTERAGLYVRRQPVTPHEARLLVKALAERSRGVPLQYVVGEHQFMDLILQVRPGVFVPRPETERLVEAALEILNKGPRQPTVVDVGTGTGAIALAIKQFAPTARVIASDVSHAAVQLARANGDRLDLDIEVLQGDLLGPVPADLRGRVDLLVSNPPYVPVEEYSSLSREVKSEPYQALVGGIDFHRRLVDAASQWLAPGGWLITEIGAAQGEVVRQVFAERLTMVEVLTDLAGRDRVVRGSVTKPTSR